MTNELDDLFSDEALASVVIDDTTFDDADVPPITNSDDAFDDVPSTSGPSGAVGTVGSTKNFGTSAQPRTFTAAELGALTTKQIHWPSKCLGCGGNISAKATVLWSSNMKKPVGCMECSTELAQKFKAAQPWSLRGIVRGVVRRARDTMSDWAVLSVQLTSLTPDAQARIASGGDVPLLLEPLTRGRSVMTELSGSVGTVRTGETIRITALVTEYNGRWQLKSVLPPFAELDDDAALASFLKRLDWVGQATATKITQAFGTAVDFMARADAWLAEYEHTLPSALTQEEIPDLMAALRGGGEDPFFRTLLEIRGLTAPRLVALLDSYHTQIALRNVYVRCAQWKLSARETKGLIELWGVKAVDKIEQDPYYPVTVGVLSWGTCEVIALQHLGIKKDDPRRLFAGAIYMLEKMGQESGDTLLPGQFLSLDDIDALNRMPEVSASAEVGDNGAQPEGAFDSGEAAALNEFSVMFDSLEPTDPVDALASTLTSRLSVATTAVRRVFKGEILSTADFIRGVREGLSRGLIVGHSEGIQLAYFYQAEKVISESFVARSRRPVDPVAIDPSHFAFPPSDEQLDAARTAVSTGIGLLTGGPGTGKTATLSGISSAFVAVDLGQPFFLAPTARAASRVTALTKCPAATVHRGFGYNEVVARRYFISLYQYECAQARAQALEAQGDVAGAQALRDEHLCPELPESKSAGKVHLLVVDETSMVDTLMAAWVLARADQLDIPRVVFVGDPGQLASIGAGEVLSSFVRVTSAVAGLSDVARKLTRIYRQASSSPIPWLAKAIDEGNHAEINRFATWQDKKQIGVFSRPVEETENTIADLVKWCQQAIKVQLHGVRSIHDIAVIVAQKSKGIGTEALNIALQAAFCPIPEPARHARFLSELQPYNCVPIMGDMRACPGTKVKHKVNDYARNVYNGDIGAIVVGPLDTCNFSNSTTVVNKLVLMDGGQIKQQISLAPETGNVYPAYQGIQYVWATEAKPNAWKIIVGYPDSMTQGGVKYVAYTEDELNAVDLAYAGTCHEWQGSSAPVTAVVLRKEHLGVATRAWLYTAVTRATDCVGIFTHSDALNVIANNISTNRRYSGLDAALENTYRQVHG